MQLLIIIINTLFLYVADRNLHASNVKSLARIIAEAKMFIQTKRSENEADYTNRYRILRVLDLISNKPKYECKQLQARPLPELPVSLVPQQSNMPPNKLQY